MEDDVGVGEREARMDVQRNTPMTVSRETVERPFFAASSKAGQLRAKYPADWDGSVDFMSFQ
jgi:hypothetical protein